jgi:hypothetical protein
MVGICGQMGRADIIIQTGAVTVQTVGAVTTPMKATIDQTAGAGFISLTGEMNGQMGVMGTTFKKPTVSLEHGGRAT